MPPRPSPRPHRAPRRSGAAGPGDVIFEFSAIGNSVKVCAIDAHTGTEVSIVGPLNAGEEALRRTALSKLKYVLERDRPQPLGRTGRYV